jgi:hypothetical protein
MPSATVSFIWIASRAAIGRLLARSCQAAFSELDRVFVGKEDLQQHMSTSLGQLITSYR